jgi:aminoglycoside phosphotransferase
MAVMGSNAPVVVPAAVEAIAAGRAARLVWVNEIGGLTFDVGEGLGRVFVKWVPPEWAASLDAEFVRLEWASQFVTVPCPIDGGSDADGAWLVTTPLDGESAVSPRWLEEPVRAVRAIGAGLRQLHKSLPVERCPFSWSAAARVTDVERRAAAGAIDPARWHDVHQTLGVETALGLAAAIPPVDVEVVCHGDACSPNTLISDVGRCAGYVDLGALGIADRWADLAVATWSVEWNYGPGWEALLLDAYGVDADLARTRYYRLLWDLGP